MCVALEGSFLNHLDQGFPTKHGTTLLITITFFLVGSSYQGQDVGAYFLPSCSHQNWIQVSNLRAKPLCHQS